MKKADLEARTEAKELARVDVAAAQPGMSVLQTTQDAPVTSQTALDVQTPEAKAPLPQPDVIAVDTNNGHVNGAATQQSLAMAPTPPAAAAAATIEGPTVNGVAKSEVDGKAEETNEMSPGTDEKEWEKLPKQDAAAASLLANSSLPPDLDWIDPTLVQHYEEMGRRGFTETAQVHPFHFTTTIAGLARSAGVDIRIGAQVTKISPSQMFPDLKTVEYEDRGGGDGGSGEAKIIDSVTDVIVTAGPWTGKILPRSKVEGLRAHSVVYEADVSPYAVFTDIQLPSDFVPEHRARAGQKRKHRGNVDPEVYARPFGEVYACGESLINMLYCPQKKYSFLYMVAFMVSGFMTD